MPRYLLGLGSSCPGGIEYIQRACLMLDKSRYIDINGCGRIYEGPALGGKTQYNFVNTAIAITTPLCPDATWFLTRSIEERLGRIRVYKDGPRTIDLDILWCIEGRFTTSNLCIPHPGFFGRPFAFRPALEAAQIAKWPMPLAMRDTGH